MDSFIFKGKSSEDFKIIINSLPPISKPPLRVEEIEIDGVDGTRYEELGYGSYEKKIRITITEDNADSLINWLKGEGNLILSNEPDKYYNAKIIEQIDFERLTKYEPTEIKFRVQPFKYEYEEEESVLSSGSTEGETITLDDKKVTQLQIDGESEQDGTPTPDTPVEIESVGYENLYDKNTEPENYYYNANGVKTNHSYKFINQKITDIDKNMTVSFKEILGAGASSGNVRFFEFDINDVFIKRTLINSNKTVNLESNTSYVIVSVDADESNAYFEELLITKGTRIHSYIPHGKYGIEVKTIGKQLFDKSSYTSGARLGSDGTNYTSGATDYFISKYLGIKPNETYTVNFTPNSMKRICFYDENKNFISLNQSNSTFTTPENATYLRFSNLLTEIDNIQLEKGTVSTNKEEYKSSSSIIVVNEPLRSLPNGVKDIAYIKNNKLYIDRKVKSIILNGSEEWKTENSGENLLFYTNEVLADSNYPNGLSDFFTVVKSYDHIYGENNCIAINQTRLLISHRSLTTVDEFKNWLSENNVGVQYELAETITEDYGSLTILELVEGENNISNSEDANMVIDYVDNKLIINNKGNHTSKPTLLIEGTGTIEVSVNDNKFFSYTFPDEESTVVIDSEKQDAYLGNVLKNRNMTGEFPTLEIGENIITWTGLVKGIKVVKKSRWL